MRILFTGGGTAGHIFPIISIAREIKKSYPKKRIDFYYVGPKDQFAEELFKKEGIKIKKILAGKFRRYFSFQNIIDIFIKTPLGILQALYYVFTISPDLIFSKGGYGSIPISFAGWLLLAPIFLHESDVSPGLANRISNFFSIEVFTSFPVKKTEYFPKKKMIAVGNPIRKEILEGSILEAKSQSNLTGEKPIIFVLGGSQGAQNINDKILLGLNDFLRDFEIIHQTGQNNFSKMASESELIADKKLIKYYHPYPFLNEIAMANAYKACDFVISRAGAGSIFEIAAAGKPSILIPLPSSAQDHQVKNAYAYLETGACVVLEEANFTSNFILQKIKFLISDKNSLNLMTEAAKSFAKPQAGKIVANYIMAYLSR